jgi:uncharacterized protein YxjI
MHPIFERNRFFIQEHVGAFQVANNYDAYDPDSDQLLLECREDVGLLRRILHFTDFDDNAPFDINVHTPEGEQVLSVHRGVAFFRSTINVRDGAGQKLGAFQQKMLSMGGSFNVMDARGDAAFDLTGSLMKRDFQFLAGDGRELGSVTKQFSGVGKELLTSADNYVLQISDDVPADSETRPLMLAAALCIDMVHKED